MNTCKRIFLSAILVILNGSALAANEIPQDPEAAMMAQIKERTSPGKAHEILAPLAGEWTYTAKFWMAPDAEPEETTGTSSHALIYGGRFLQQTVKGSWMGEPFEGVGILGYDNIKGEYVNIWYDSMATGIMTIAGQYDSESSTLNLSGENSCPMTGETHRKARVEYMLTGPDQNTYVSYTVAPDGQEFKAMEIHYTRVV